MTIKQPLSFISTLFCGLLSSLLVALPSWAASPKPFLTDSYQGIMTANQQQPLLVVLWSLDCPPCRAEMPELAEFSASHPGIGLVLISVDGVEAAAETAAVLAENDLESASNWIFADPYIEKLRFQIDPSWQGELPRSYLYVPGEQRHRIRGRIDFTRLEEYLLNLKQ